MKKVFLSSVAQGLEAHRREAYQAISALDGYHCVGMEDFGARDAAPADLCREKVRECDIFVGVIGPRYGSCPSGSEISFTELEYETAVKQGMRRLIFVTQNDFPLAEYLREDDVTYKKLVAFRARVLADRGSAFFSSETELALLVATALHNSQPAEASFRAYCQPALVRREGWTEVLGPVQITVTGLKRPERVSITLTIDTYLTNYYDASGASDALISSERRGVLQYGRRPDTLNKVVFDGVALDQCHSDGDETLTISGIRADVCDAGDQITAVLEVSSGDTERGELLRAPLVLALVPSETQFAVTRVADCASFIGQAPEGQSVRSYIVEFFGAFPGAFKTRDEESVQGCRAVKFGTVLRLNAVIYGPAGLRSSDYHLFVTTRNLPRRVPQGADSLGEATLISASASGVPQAPAGKPAKMFWKGSLSMVESELVQTCWEVISPVRDAILRFGFCVVGPAEPKGCNLHLWASLAPKYSTAAAHMPSSSLPIPRFRIGGIDQLVSLPLD